MMTLIFWAVVALLAVEVTCFLNNLLIVRQNIKTNQDIISNLRTEKEFLLKGIENQNKKLEEQDKQIGDSNKRFERLSRKLFNKVTKYAITPEGIHILDIDEIEKIAIDNYKATEELKARIDSKIEEENKNRG